MFGSLALMTAALFTGAAIYVSWAEHPARLELDDRALLAQWKPSYERGAIMQASLALAGLILGALEWLATGNWLWIAGGLILAANWPFTMYAIMPTNKVLKDISIEQAGSASRALLEKWGQLHAVRSALGALATAIFLWASM